MTRIVASGYRYKRPPRKRKSTAPLEGPRIAKAADPAKIRKRAKAAPAESTPATPVVVKRAGASVPPAPAANDDRKPTETAKRSPIATARRPGKRYAADVPEVTEEEHRAIGDRADALFQEMKRVIAEKIRS
jgi:hypothetical protein